MIVAGHLLLRLRFTEVVAAVNVPRGRRRGGERVARTHWPEFDRLLEAIHALSISRVHEPIPLWQLRHPRWSSLKRRLDSAFLVRFDPDRIDAATALETMREWKRVISAGLNHFVVVGATPPLVGAPSGGPAFGEQIDLSRAWGFSRGSSRVTVAVIDSGIAANHTAFADRLRLEAGCDVVDVSGVHLPHDREWIGDIDNPDDEPGDEVGHGTHMSALVAGAGFGVAPGCRVLPIRALASVRLASGEIIAMGKQDDLARAIRFAVDKQASIINCSYANAAADVIGPSQIERDAIDDAVGAGCFVVAAMGNDGDIDRPKYPARFDSVCGVAAIDESDGRWMESVSHGSERGAHCDLSAPGAHIEGASHQGGSEFRSGTSAATAIVSGAAALVQSFALERMGSVRPGEELGRLLTSSARRLWPGSMRRTRELGFGCVNPAAAMERLIET